MAQNAVSAESAGPEVNRRPARPIDLVHLARQCLGDAGLEHEILRLFDTTAKTYFSRLQQSSTFDELAMNLHSIKGAASGVGAWAIADLARSAETDLKAGRPLTAEQIADIGIAVEEVGAFVTEMLSNEPI